MGERGGRGGGKMGGISFTKHMPNFLQQFGTQPDADGIEGALERHKDRDAEDREDREDEAPLVVEALDALSSRERKKATGSRGAALFKGGRAADKFQASAHRAVEEASINGSKKEASDVTIGVEEARGGKMSFKSAKLKKRAAADPKSGQPSAKASKNTILLSFSQDDDEDA